jgi:hypothetical protein
VASLGRIMVMVSRIIILNCSLCDLTCALDATLQVARSLVESERAAVSQVATLSLCSFVESKAPLDGVWCVFCILYG